MPPTTVRPLPRLRLLAAALVGTVALGASGAAAQEPPVDTSTAHISPELAAVPVDGDAYDDAQAAYERTAEQLRTATANHTGAAQELVDLATQETTLTARIGQATAARKAATIALMQARRGVQAAAVSSYVAEAGADDLTRVVDPDESVAVGRVQAYADSVRADSQGLADQAQATVDAASRTVLDAQRARQAGRDRVAAVTAARDSAGADVARLTADLATLADDEARVRATSRVHGTDFTLTALDAYWRAAASQPACGVQWWAIAGISRVEGHHGQFHGSRVLADGEVTPSIIGIPLDGQSGTRLIPDTDGGALDGDTTYDRAVGPMQFIPSTWRRWATDGDGDGAADPQNLYDATATAAAYLCHGRDLSTEDGLRAAYYSYNRSQTYVETVLAHAEGYAQVVIPPAPPA